ncbi:MAG: YhbY family RNA-binding protein [Sulfolobales archaeon]
MQKSRKVVRAVIGKPHIYIGKGGINENVLNDIKNHLKREGVVKIRVMKSFKTLNNVDIDSVAHEVANMVNGEVVDVRGSTFALVRKRGSAAGGT